MKKQILVGMIFILLILPMIMAEPSFIFKRSETVDLKIPAYAEDNARADNTISCYITVRSPNSTLTVDNQAMTFNAGGLYNYTITNNLLEELGEYPTAVSCDGGTVYGFSTFTFEITPTGDKRGIDLFLILLISAFGALIIAYFVGEESSNYIGFLAGILFLMAGIYGMIYGIAGLSDLYTRTISMVCLGVGLIFIFISAYNFARSDND